MTDQPAEEKSDFKGVIYTFIKLVLVIVIGIILSIGFILAVIWAISIPIAIITYFIIYMTTNKGSWKGFGLNAIILAPFYNVNNVLLWLA